MNNYNDYDYTFKIALTGNSGVGKSSLMMRFTDDYFTESLIPTIGVDFKIRSIDVNNKVVKFSIWDTAGQERFEAIVKAYYKGIHACVIIFDLTDRQSFIDVTKWIDKLKANSKQNVRAILIGNKSDAQEERVVRTEEAMHLAQELGMNYIETSAKTKENVDNLFMTLAKELVADFVDSKKAEEPIDPKKRKINLSKPNLLPKPENKKNTCC